MESLGKLLDTIEMRLAELVWNVIGIGLIFTFLYSMIENKDHNFLRGM
jgi:hypothetical protein